MFRFGNFTPKANTAINLAIQISGELGHTYVGSEHLLWGLAGEGAAWPTAPFRPGMSRPAS